MPHESQVAGWTGRTLFDADGAKVGTIEDVFADERTGEAAWATVSAGLFGRKHHFVPIAGAREVQDGVAVPIDGRLVKDAPRVDEDGELSLEDEAVLYRHYGLADGEDDGDGDGEAAPEPSSAPEPAADPEPAATPEPDAPDEPEPAEEPTPGAFGAPAAVLAADSDAVARERTERDRLADDIAERDRLAEDVAERDRLAVRRAHSAPPERPVLDRDLAHRDLDQPTGGASSVADRPTDGAAVDASPVPDHASSVPEARVVGRPHVDGGHRVRPDRIIDPSAGVGDPPEGAGGPPAEGRRLRRLVRALTPTKDDHHG